jgi:hypothetical protein
MALKEASLASLALACSAVAAAPEAWCVHVAVFGHTLPRDSVTNEQSPVLTLSTNSGLCGLLTAARLSG